MMTCPFRAGIKELVMLGIKLGKYTVIYSALDTMTCDVIKSNWFRTTLERRTMTGDIVVAPLTIAVLWRLWTGELVRL